jgi:hypothetical protein
MVSGNAGKSALPGRSSSIIIVLTQSGQGSLPLHPAGLPVGQAMARLQNWAQQAASALRGQVAPSNRFAVWGCIASCCATSQR